MKLPAVPTITARNTLQAMWPLIFKARTRPLTEVEADEVRRLCEILQRGIPGKDAYNEAVDNLCMSVHSSGVLTGNAESADAISDKIDELREKLDSPDGNQTG